MADWHGYFAIQDLALTNNQRDTLWDALKAFGQRNASQLPSERMHYRINNDNSAIIFEAVFDDNTLTIDAMKQRLANIFGVNVSNINHTATQQTFDISPTPIVTFSAGGTNRLRMALFGGVGASWNDSRIEAVAYISANIDDWESA